MKANLIVLSTIFFVSAFILLSCMQNQTKQAQNMDEDKLKVALNTFIDQWHRDAANADPAYFEKIAANGIYIGTDKSELWTKKEFQSWSEKYFDAGKAWSFKTISRNIYFSDNKDFAWFDELLDTQMGVCRSSGVVKMTGSGWEIVHYHLSVTVPNDLLNDFITLVNTFEER